MESGLLTVLTVIYSLSPASGFTYSVESGTAEYIGQMFNIESPVNKSGSMFLGIPYAEPPTGVRRFSKPVLKEVMGRFNATNYGPPCMPTPNSANTGSSEDCLSINVFVPGDTLNGRSKAVMLWIYGGAFVTGRSEIYDPRYLALLGDVIVVTFNYRLGVLGFLSTGDSIAPGNLGLWDQQGAITWVHRNIEYFGGDKNRVTIFGESAGGASVTYQALYGGNKGLFQRAIAESGSSAAIWASSNIVPSNTKRLAESFGCDVSSSQTTVDCLRKISPFELLEATASLPTFTDPLPFLPTRDDTFINYDPRRAFDVKATDEFASFRNIDYLMGINDYDGLVINTAFGPPASLDNGVAASYLSNVIVPLTIGYFTTDSNIKPILESLISYRYRSFDDRLAMVNLEQLLKLFTDLFFVVPGLNSANKHVDISADQRTFVYRFRHRFPLSSVNIKGANHGDEIPYVFGWITNPERLRINGTQEDDANISEAIIKYWANFAKFGFVWFIYYTQLRSIYPVVCT